MKEQIKCYDTQSCIRCFACMIGCSTENKARIQRDNSIGVENSSQDSLCHLNYLTPKRVEIGTYPNAKQITAFHHCNHCENSPCQSICPTGAITTRKGGEVVINPDMCIGCQSCGDACPFDVPVYAKEDGKAYKCTGCYDRVENGLKQACVSACPTGAMFSGNADEVLIEAKKRAALYTEKSGKKHVVYGADSLNGYVGKLKWITIVEESDLAAYQLDTSPNKLHMQLRDFAKGAGCAIAAATAVASVAHLMFWLDKRKKKIAEAKGDSHE